MNGKYMNYSVYILIDNMLIKVMLADSAYQ